VCPSSLVLSRDLAFIKIPATRGHQSVSPLVLSLLSFGRLRQLPS
jgi:hypothetical protein